MNPKDSTQAFGRTTQNKLCYFPGEGLTLKGSLVSVKVNDVRAYTLSGTLI